MIDYSQIDVEIRNLVCLLNKVEGITTIESCYGHGVQPCRIWFKCNRIEDLHKFMFNCLNAFTKWRVLIDNADVSRNIDFIYCLESDASDRQLVDLIVRNLETSIKTYIARKERYNV